jgi:YD repeat-containing protein
VIGGTLQLELDIEYNFPNNYCQTWDPPDTWPIDGFGWPNNGQITRLRLYSTDAAGGNRVLQIGPIPAVFEYGRWLPQITLPSCSWDVYYQVELQHCGGFVNSPVTHVTVAPQDCAQAKPECSTGTSVGPGGVPIALRSASPSLTTAVPTREEAPIPGPLGPRFFYNGNTPSSGGAGLSWFMTYGDSLVTGGPGLLIWTDARGFRTTFSGSDAAGYDALDPGDGRGHITLVGSEYILTTPDGVTRTFLTGSKGFWKKTVDRWGSGALGNPTTSARATTIQELIGGAFPSGGRQITLAYDTGGRLTSVTDVNSKVTILGYDLSGRLETICAADQTCPPPPSEKPWRRFAYDGITTRILTVKDRTDSFIRGWEYNTSGGTFRTWTGSSTYSAAAAKERTEYALSGSDVIVKRKKPDESTAETTYTVVAKGGVWRVSSINGACPECGDENSTRMFDATTGRVLTRTNGNGKTTTFGYDADGNVLQMVEDSTGLMRTTSFTYAVPGQFPAVWPSTTKDFWRTKTEPSGAKVGCNVVTTRSWSGLVLSEATSGFLSAAGSCASSVTRTTQTTYDSFGRPLSTDGPRPVADVTTYSYYAGTDAFPNKNLVQRTTGPDGVKTKFEYHALGGVSRLTREITAGSTADAVTEYAYDAVGRRTGETVKATPLTTEADLATTFTFDVAGHLTLREIKEGSTTLTKTAMVYESGTDRLLTRTNPDARFGSTSGEQIKYTYDDRGNVTRETYGYFNGAGTTTEYDVTRVYDGLCRVKKQTFPLDAPQPDPAVDDATTRFAYDCAGNLTGIVDANHFLSDASQPNLVYGYDGLNRLTSVTRTISPPPDDVTTYVYDLRDQLTSVVDPNGAMTTYVVDDFGALRQQLTPLAGGGVADETNYVYDEANNVTSVTQVGIRSSSRTYDVANRLLTITGTPLSAVTHTYDTVCLPDPVSGKTFGRGRLCKVSDGTATTEFAYDRRGLVVKEKVTLVATPGPGSKAYELTYQYDAAGRRKLVTYPAPVGDSVMTSFDVNNRPLDFMYTTGGNPSKLLGKIAHQINGPVRSFQTLGGIQEARTFDTRFQRLTQRTFSLGTNPMTLLAGWRYGDGRLSATAYDKEGNVKAIDDVTPGISPPSNRVFGYDPGRYFMTSSTGPYGAAFASQTLSWLYDRNGNRTSETRGASTTNYTYENDGAGHSNGVIASLSPGSTVNHLNSGDLSTDEQGILYSYDALGRLTQAESASGCSPAAKNVLKRDSAGHRAIRQVYPCNSSSPSKTEYFVYGSDGNLYFREVYNGSNSLTDREAYVYLENEPVAILRTFGSPTGNFFLHNDHLGRPLEMTGSDGLIKWKREFEPFGKSLAARVNTAFEPGFRFPGQWEYSDSGSVTGAVDILSKINALEDNWNRTYAARWGRYTQPDPRAAWGTSFYSPTVAGLTTEEPTDLVFDGEPLFAYVGNNPIGRLDPDGLRWFSKSEPAWHDKCRGASPLSPGNPKACQYGDLSFNLGFQTWDLSCVCTTMPDDPGANCARGCIQCARDQGADVTRAHPHLWCKKKCRKDGLWTFRNDQQFSDAVNRTCTRCWFQYPLTR